MMNPTIVLAEQRVFTNLFDPSILLAGMEALVRLTTRVPTAYGLYGRRLIAGLGAATEIDAVEGKALVSGTMIGFDTQDMRRKPEPQTHEVPTIAAPAWPCHARQPTAKPRHPQPEIIQ